MLINFSGDSSKSHAGIYIETSVFLSNELRDGCERCLDQ